MNIQEFIDAFAEAIEVKDVTLLTPETKFRELEEWSSISIMLLVPFFDENFGKEINYTTLKGCSSINDLFELSK